MKRLLCSLLLLANFPLWASECKLNGPLFSLSGTSTVILKELNLLADPNLKGISIFNPISKEDYSGSRLGGGLFLSRREDKVFGSADVIFDHGRELNRYFKNRNYPSISINSVGKRPHETILMTLQIVEGKISGCEKELSTLKNKVSELQKSKFKAPRKIIFFLGEITSQKKLPEMVYGQDGFVLELSESGQIKTYPSKLNYIHWSQKILNSLEEDYVFVGLKEPRNQLDKKIQKLDQRHVNIVFPGALTPGYSQLELIKYIVDNL